mmetsp:Transcript_27327/g.47806  ORF Transcript_27327/g.47806 Transcript_27327/m.47806 type:complete len:209 (-) Transcript_27327:143-769(-)
MTVGRRSRVCRARSTSSTSPSPTLRRRTISCARVTPSLFPRGRRARSSARPARARARSSPCSSGSTILRAARCCLMASTSACLTSRIFAVAWGWLGKSPSSSWGPLRRTSRSARAARPLRRRSKRPPKWRTRTSLSPKPSAMGTTRRSATAAASCPADRSSAWRSRVRLSRSPRCSSWMRRLRPWTTRARKSSRKPWTRSCKWRRTRL